MAVLTIALLVEAVEYGLWSSRVSLLLGALLIVLGSLMTCVSRTIGIAERLNAPSR